jgi:ABC-type glycerol-3-phosphate transport system permease component
VALPALRRAGLLLLLSLYTAYAAGPLLWVATMSLRTTSEIGADPYGLPWPAHWGKFRDAWVNSNYDVYFTNSLLVVLSAKRALCAAKRRSPISAMSMPAPVAAPLTATI